MVKPPKGTLWRHLKTNGVYVVEDHCIIEATNKAAVLYRRANDTKAPLWCRPCDEFMDGRFVQVSHG